LWNNTETVILLLWPRVSDCILCWPFGQYSPSCYDLCYACDCVLADKFINEK